jgi:6-phosphogluconolactonase
VQHSVIAAVALALTASVPLPSSRTFVYVGNSDSQDISVLRLESDGELTPLATVAVPGPAVPGTSLPLAVSPDKKFLYAGLRNQPYSVVTFALDGRSGSLRYVGKGPLDNSMAYIATDRTGRFLLSASYDGDEVTVSPIGSDGVVGATAQKVATKPKAHCILPDAANRHVLHTSLGGDVIYQDNFDPATGRLSPNDPATVSVKPKAGPRHLRFSPDERFVYLVNELDASIYVFPYDAASGTLQRPTQVATALPNGFSGKPWAADIHLTPDGKLLYASERTSSTLAAFRVNSGNGKLTSIGSYPTARQPRGFNIDPGGRYLLAVGQRSDSMMTYSIDGASGKLTALKTYPMGKNPNWIEIVALP